MSIVTVRNGGSELCSYLGMIQEIRQKWLRALKARKRRAVKIEHAAAIDKAICLHRADIVSDDDFEP